jgi:hypothetical protein
MANETNPTAPVPPENIPANAGQVSAIASASAPFVYFEDATFWRLLNGIGQVTLEASTMRASPDGGVAVDRVVVAHLRGNLRAMMSLRAALDNILLLAEPIEGPAN